MAANKLYSPNGSPIVGTVDTVPALTTGEAWRNEDGCVEFEPAYEADASKGVQLDWHAKEQVWSTNRLGVEDPLYQDAEGFVWHECDLTTRAELAHPRLDQTLSAGQQRLLNDALAKQLTALIFEAIDEGRPHTAKFLAIALRELAAPSGEQDHGIAEAA